MGYAHEKLGDSERRRIERRLARGEGVRDIARALARSVSTISDEIRRGSVAGVYDAKKAGLKAVLRRRYAKVQTMRVVREPSLRAYVEEKIGGHDWSPEMVAGRIKNVDWHLPKVSTKAIYKFVYSVYGRKLEKRLYRKRVKTKSGPKRGKQTAGDGRISIEKRPKSVLKRLTFGHFEGDFIESGKGGQGSLLVLVERKTRYPFLAYCADRSTAAVNALVSSLLADVPVESLTLDNDVSFQKHEELSLLLEALVYFCHPYTSSEKGTVENRNGKVRAYGIPKKTDLSKLSPEAIRAVEQKLRSFPLKCLGFRTPEEAWVYEMQKAARRGSGMLEANVLKARSGCSD